MHGKRTAGSSLVARALRALPAFAWLTAITPEAVARPGTHPIVVSTWDARASSVVLGYRHGSFDGGGLNELSYHANFSSTGGKLSSQFGLYYLNLSSDGSDPTAHGLSGSATAVFNLPVARRFNNGLPLAAIDFYLGSAPTALVSGERNYLTLPLVIGFGVPLTPAKAITITPWFELSPSVNLDTEIHEFHLTPEDATKYVTVTQNPTTGRPDVTVNFNASDVESLIGESVDLKTSAAVGARAGLDLALHVSDYFDLGLNATLSSFGSAFSGTRVLYLGGGFIWRWDDIVPAVLPAENRLLHESCDDVEARFRSCPNSRKWRSPEDIERLYGSKPGAPAMPTENTPAVPATTPVAPTPAVTPAAPADPTAPSPAPATDGAAPAGVNGSFPQ